MADWLIFIGALALYAWAIRCRIQSIYPTDPKHWKAPGLSMRVIDGKIHYRREPTP